MLWQHLMYSNRIRNRSIISTDRQIEYVLQSPPCSNLIEILSIPVTSSPS